MIKIIQLTDTHLLAGEGTLFDSDPAQRLEAAVADINRQHGDAALCVLTGDLAHAGSAAAYRRLRAVLAGLVIPYRLVLGNHDDRAALRAVFPEQPVDARGLIQSVLDVEGHALLFLDTVEAGTHSGRYGAERQAWLRDALAACAGRPAFLFMHHPPMPLSLPRLDQYRIDPADAAAMGAILDAAPHVRHLFFGHVHRPVSGGWRGKSFSSLRGTNHQNWLDFSVGRENISSLEPPAYAVAFLGEEGVTVHLHDFLDANPRYVYDPDAPADRQIRRLD